MVRSDEAELSAPLRAHWLRVLLVLPFIGTLWVSFYDTTEPRLLALPFFYWYQMLWIILSAVIIGIVHRVER
jgi:hypothetical protein